MKTILRSGLVLSMMLVGLLLSSCNSSTKPARTAQEAEYVIVAHLTLMPEFKDEITEAFAALVEGTRNEPGNVSYVLYQHTDDPLKFTFVEEWASQDAIDAHNGSDHFKAFSQIVDGKADLAVYTMKQKI